MTPEIIRKLSEVLGEPLSREMQAVYILAEIRKLLELERLKSKYPSLNFHCCWVLHATAKGVGADRILKRFDDAYAYWKDIHSAPKEIVLPLGRTMALSSFKLDLKLFLSKMQLPGNVVTDEAQWLKFLTLYSEIIRDCPFKLSGTNKVALEHLKSIVVSPINVDVPDATESFLITRWDLLGGKGEIVASFLNLFPELPMDLSADQISILEAKIAPRKLRFTVWSE